MEQIGLEAVFDLSQFDKGIAGYLKGLDKADDATQSMGGKFGKSFEQMGQGVLKVAGLLSGALAAAAVAAGAAITGFALNGIKQASDLESKMGGIASIMGETKDAVEPLKNLILDLGMDPTLKVNATEAADAIEKLASNGLTMTQIMDGAAKSTVLLANSTGADFDTAAAVATDAMALFNIEAANMQEAVNGITGVTVASKFDINDYKMALAQAGGVASAAGVEMEDFNATIAGISNYFAAGSDAGTSYKTMLLRLNPQTDEAASAMKALGLEFFDANGNMKSMAEISTELNDAFAKEITFTSTVSNLTDEQAARKKKLEQTIKSLTTKLADYQSGIAGVAQSENEKVVAVDRLNRQLVAAQAEYANYAAIQSTTTSTTRALTEEEKTHYLNVIFGTDAMRAAVAMSEQGEVAYTDLGVAAKELGVSIDELTQYADGGITKFEAMLISIGKTDAVESAKVRMDNFKGSMEILQGVIDTVALKIGFAFLPMLKNMADSLSNFISNHADQIVLFFENFAGAIDAFVTGAPGDFPWEDIFPPWLAVVMYAISNLVEGISIALTDFNSGAMGLDYPWEDIFPPSLANVIYFITQNVDAFTGALGGVAALLASAGIAAAISGITAALMGLLSPIALMIAGAAALGAAWNSNFLGMKDATFAALTAITGAFEPLTTAIQEFGTGAIVEITSFVTGNQTAFTNLEAIWNAAVVSVQNLFTSIVSSVTANLPLWQAQLVQWGVAIMGWVSEAAVNVGGKVAEWFTALTSAMAAYLPTLIATLLEWSAVFINWVSVAATNISAKIAEWFAALSTSLAANLPTWIATLLEWGAAMINWIGSAATNVGAKVNEWFIAITTAVSANLPGWIATLTPWATAIGQWLIDAAAAVGGKVAAWATSLTSALVANLPSMLATLLNWSAALVDWIGLAIAGTIIKIGEWGASLVGWLTGTGKTQLDESTVGLTASLIDWIINDLIPQVAPSMATFGAALANAVVLIAGAMAVSAQSIATAIWTAIMSTNWTLIGTNILTLIQAGWETTKATVLPVLGVAATDIWNKFTEINWQQLGTDILTYIKDGWELAKAAVLPVIGAIATDLKTKFTEIDWKAVGNTVLSMVKDGIEAAKALLLSAVAIIAVGLKTKFTEIDWKALGTTALTYIKDGWESVKSTAWTAVALIATGLKTKFTEIDWKAVGTDALTLIKDGWEATKATITTTVGAIAASLKTKFNETDWGQLGTDTANAIRDGLRTAAEIGGGIISIALDVATGIKNAFTDQSWIELGTTISNQIKTGLDIAAKAADGLIAQMGTIATDLGNKLIETDWQEVGRSIARFIKDGFKAAAEAIDGLLATATTVVNDVIKRIMNGDWSGTGNGIMAILTGAVKAAAYAAGGLIYVVGQIAIGILEEFTGVDFDATAKEMIDAIRDGIRSAADAASGLIDTALVIAEDVITEFTSVNWADEVGAYLMNKIRDGVKSAVDAAGGLYETFRGIVASIKKIFTDMIETWKGIGTAIVEGIGEGINSAQDLLKKKAQELANSLPDWVKSVLGISSPSRVFMEIGRNVVDGLINGLEERQSALTATVAKITKTLTISDILSLDLDATDEFSQMLQDRVDGLKAYNVSAQQWIADTRREISQIQNRMQITGISSEAWQQLNAQLTAAQNKLAGFNASLNSNNALLANAQSLIKWGNVERNNIDFMTKQLDLFNQAVAAGIDVSGINIGDFSAENLAKMAAIEKRIADLKQMQLIYTLKEIRAATARADQFKSTRDAIAHVEKYNDFLGDQMSLMKKAADLGLDLAQIWNNGVVWDATDQQKMLDIQLRIASASGASIKAQMEQMITEQKRVRGLASAMERLQPLIDQTNVSSAFGQKYKAEVLDPMLRALEKSAGIDSERVRLINEYTAAAQKLIEINKKEDQLDFLKQQMDIIKMIQDQDIPGGNSLFEGLTLGLNASIDDLLGLTSRTLDGMIKQVKDQLGIHSPSAVFADIGKQMMSGLSQGIQANVMRPLSALRQSTVAHGAMSTRTLNFAMGGVTINTPMDEVMFESRVLRILERSMN